MTPAAYVAVIIAAASIVNVIAVVGAALVVAVRY
jgi:hypothetical protein